MSAIQNRHWTEDSTDDFVHRIVGDFVRFVENAMGDSISQIDLANKLGVSAGRVSQVLNNPGNLSLKTIVQFARAVGAKVSVLGYCDDDPQNTNGPVSPEVFTECWEKCGKPHDFFTVSVCPQTIYMPYMIDVKDLKIENEVRTNSEYMAGERITTAHTPNMVRRR